MKPSEDKQDMKTLKAYSDFENDVLGIIINRIYSHIHTFIGLSSAIAGGRRQCASHDYRPNATARVRIVSS